MIIKIKELKEIIKKIIAVKRLLSEDILLSILTEKARIELEKNNAWLRAVAPSAEIRRTTFPVFIHGMRV
jgi:hypothetical protein